MGEAVQISLVLMGVYALVGAAFAAGFVVRGAGMIDPVAARAPARVRLLFAPGAVALWPILTVKWARARRAP